MTFSHTLMPTNSNHPQNLGAPDLQSLFALAAPYCSWSDYASLNKYEGSPTSQSIHYRDVFSRVTSTRSLWDWSFSLAKRGSSVCLLSTAHSNSSTPSAQMRPEASGMNEDFMPCFMTWLHAMPARPARIRFRRNQRLGDVVRVHCLQQHFPGHQHWRWFSLWWLSHDMSV